MDEQHELSVVVPLYNCGPAIGELVTRLHATLQPLVPSYQIILVNDGSPGNDWAVVTELAAVDATITGVNLSRNFGQHIAITAGLGYSRAHWVVVMDGDLQDRPEEIRRLYARAQEGCDAVVGRRQERQDTLFKRASSHAFWRVFDYLAGTRTDGAVGNFGIYSAVMITNYLRFTEHVRVFPLLLKWQGFDIASIDVEHGRRLYGESSYSLRQLISNAFDVLISHSNRPLKLSIKFGFFLALFSFVYLSWLILRKYLFAVPLGWTSLMTSIFFVGGLLFANLGLIGLYIGKIYDETKNRPLYIVKETLGPEPDRGLGRTAP